MPGENIMDWSTTAATNATADSSIGWAEGQARSTVNDSARSMMAAVAKSRNLLNGSITTAGTANAQTFTSGVSYTSVPTGLLVMLKAGALLTNSGSTTLNMDGIGAVTIKNQAGNNLVAGEITAGQYVNLRYDGTNWILLTPTKFATGAFSGAVSMAGLTATTGAFSGAVTGASFTASGSVTAGAGGALVSAASATTGTIYFGSNLVDYLTCDGATYTFGPGNVALQGGLSATTGAFSGAVSMAGLTATTGGFSGAVSMAGLSATTGTFSSLVSAQGYWTRAGLSGAFGGNYFNINYSGGQVQLWIDDSNQGNLSFGPSDARLKTDLKPLVDPGGIIDALEIVDFEWIDSGTRSAGVIAQDAVKVLPDMVHVGDSDPNKKLGDEGFQPWRVYYEKLVPHLIAEVQSLRKRVATLETKITH